MRFVPVLSETTIYAYMTGGSKGMYLFKGTHHVAQSQCFLDDGLVDSAAFHAGGEKRSNRLQRHVGVAIVDDVSHVKLPVHHVHNENPAERLSFRCRPRGKSDQNQHNYS